MPRAQLRHFAADAERRFIHVLDKRTGASYPASMENAGSENDFNTVELDGGKWNFEDLFEQVDTRSHGLVADIVERRSLSWFEDGDRVALVDLVATQLLRTPLGRTTPRYIAERLRETVRGMGYDPDEDPSMAMPTEAETRLSAIRAFLERDAHAIALHRLLPALYRVEDCDPLILSDHPVVQANAFAYGDNGLSSPGVMVFLPVAPDLALALHCPTVVRRYRIGATSDIDPARKVRMTLYLEGLMSGEPIRVDREAGAWLNAQQIAGSSRFIYSGRDDFDFVRRFLDDNDDLRSVDSMVRLGEIGRAPPPREGMPPGLHLVVVGPADHCMLKILALDESGEGLTARTDRIGLLAQIEADTGMLQTTLYRDGQAVRMMNEAMVERFGAATDGWFRVVHRDPAMRALGKHLDHAGRSASTTSKPSNA